MFSSPPVELLQPGAARHPLANFESYAAFLAGV
jgi:hypothetical protein